MRAHNKGLNQLAASLPLVSPIVGHGNARARPAMLALICLMALASAAKSYDSISDALTAPARANAPYPLPESAVQYVIDRCGLPWVTGWKNPAGGAFDVRPHLSDNHRFVLLSRAQRVKEGRGDPAEYALVSAESGLLWMKTGGWVTDPVVSAEGLVALYEYSGTTATGPPPLRLLVLGPAGDTLRTDAWNHRAYQPIVLGFAEPYGFSPEGRYLLTTMTTPGSGHSTLDFKVRCFDLASDTTHATDLGTFWPRTLHLSSQGASLVGVWPPYAFFRDRPQPDRGSYEITWSPWSVTRVVTP